MVKVTLGHRPAVDPDDLLVAVDAIEEAFGVRLRSVAIEQRLDATAQRQLVALTRKPELDQGEMKVLRALVDTVDPGLVRRAEDAQAARRARVEEARARVQGKPRRVLLEEGWAALPSGVLDDVLGGELVPSDLTYLSLVVLTFSTGKISHYAAGSGGARFDGDVLMVTRRGRGLVEDLDSGAVLQGPGQLSIGIDGTLKRLSQREWLEVERQADEVRLRPGRRLKEAGGT